MRRADLIKLPVLGVHAIVHLVTAIVVIPAVGTLLEQGISSVTNYSRIVSLLSHHITLSDASSFWRLLLFSGLFVAHQLVEEAGDTRLDGLHDGARLRLFNLKWLVILRHS